MTNAKKDEAEHIATHRKMRWYIFQVNGEKGADRSSNIHDSKRNLMKELAEGDVP